MCDGQVKEMQDILQSQEHYISVSTQDNLLIHFLLNVYRLILLVKCLNYYKLLLSTKILIYMYLLL